MPMPAHPLRFDFAPFRLSGVVVGALLNHRPQLVALGDAVHQPPHKAAPVAPVLAIKPRNTLAGDGDAIVVPDGSVWRVNGGVGLRPMERRLVLAATHWLVTEVALGGRALVVGDAEAVRPHLAGAPLAGWEHLLAVPVPEVNAAVVVARSRTRRPFDETDLEAVVGPVQDAVGLLSAAMATRRLARILAPLAEDDV